jgi:hypothetical protein
MTNTYHTPTHTQHTTSRMTCISSRVTAIGIAQTQEDKGCSSKNGVSSEVTFCTQCGRRTSRKVLKSNQKGLIGLLEQVEKGGTLYKGTKLILIDPKGSRPHTG